MDEPIQSEENTPLHKRSSTVFWTELQYSYCDGLGNRETEYFYLSGRMKKKETKFIKNKLVGACFFLPRQVGLRTLQADVGLYNPRIDHIWHELDVYDIIHHQGKQLPDDVEFFDTVEGFIDRFRSVKDWDIETAIAELEDDGLD